MNLRSLTEDLSRIAAHKPPVLEQTLQAMISLCADIQAHCDCDIYDGTVSSYRDLNNRLTFLSELLCEIYNTHKEGIRKNTGDTFNEELRTVQKETREAKRRMLAQEDQRDALTEAQAELKRELEKEKKALEELSGLEREKNALRDALEQTVSRIKSIDLPGLTGRISELEQEKTQLKGQQEESEGRISTLQKDIEAQKRDCGSKDTQCRRLTEELEQCKSRLTASEDKRRKLQEELDKTAEAETTACSRCKELTEQIKVADERLILLRENIQRDEAGLKTTQADITVQQGIYDELTPKVSSSTAALEELKQKITEAQNTIDRNEAAIAAAAQELARKHETITGQERELALLGSDIARAEARIAGLEQLLQTAADTLAQRTAKRDAKAQELDGLHEILRQRTEELAELEAQCAAANARIQELMQKIAVAQTRITNLNDRKAGLQAALDAAEAEIADLNQRITDLQQAYGAALTRIEALKPDQAAADAALAAAQAEEARLAALVAEALAAEAVLKETIAAHEQTLERLKDVDAQILTAQAALDTANGELTAATADRDGLRQKLRQTRDDTALLKQESEALAPQVQTAETERTDCQKVRDGLNDSLANAKNQVEALKKQSADLQTELDKVNADIPVQQKTADELDANITEAKGLRETMLQKVYSLREELSYQNTQNEKFRDGDLKTAEDDLANAKVLLHDMTVRRDGLKQQQETVRADREKVDREIGNTEFDLKIKQSALDEGNVILIARKKEYDAKERELDEITRQIAAIAEELKPLIVQIEEEKKNLADLDVVALSAKYESTLAALKQKVADAKAMKEDLTVKTNAYNDVRAEYEQLKVQKQNLEDDFRLLSADLGRLKDPKVQAESERLSKTTKKLEEIRNQILGAAKSIDADGLNARDSVDVELKYVDSILDVLRSGISQYVEEMEALLPNVRI